MKCTERERFNISATFKVNEHYLVKPRSTTKDTKIMHQYCLNRTTWTPTDSEQIHVMLVTFMLMINPFISTLSF